MQEFSSILSRFFVKVCLRAASWFLGLGYLNVLDGGVLVVRDIRLMIFQLRAALKPFHGIQAL